MTAYFLIQMAARMNLSITVDLFEKKDFSELGPKGCNHCGGIISESLIQMLAMEGVVLPYSVVQRGIEAYVVHADGRRVKITAPSNETRIASVYRGSGPKGAEGITWLGFDDYMLKVVIASGGNLIRSAVNRVELRGDMPVIHTDTREYGPYDLVVGAVGMNIKSQQLFDNIVGAEKPDTLRCYISELHLGAEKVRNLLGGAMHVFIQDIEGVEFSAIVPKKEYATICLLGDIDRDNVMEFLGSDDVQALFASDPDLLAKSCNCLPTINVNGLKRPFADRVALIGDCGVTRLFKDGIGAAYRHSKALASTVVFNGVSDGDFAAHYLPALKKMRRDNNIGKFLFVLVGIINGSKLLRRAAIAMAAREQGTPGGARDMTFLMWNIFTGSAPYQEIGARCLKPQFILRYLGHVVKSLFVST